MHPNEEKSIISDVISRRPSYLIGMGSSPSSWVNSAFVNWFVNFDETKLRPWLIRNYSLRMVAMQDQFDDIVRGTQLNVKDEDADGYYNASFMWQQDDEDENDDAVNKDLNDK